MNNNLRKKKFNAISYYLKYKLVISVHYKVGVKIVIIE